MGKKLKRVYYFTPHSSIWVTNASNAYILRSLASNFEVTNIACGGMLAARCASMDEANLDPSLATESRISSICDICKTRSASAAKSARVRKVFLDDFLRLEDWKEADRLLKDVDGENWKFFSVDSIPVGRFASYEFSLRHKFYSNEIPADLLGDYLAQLRSAVLTLLAWRRFQAQERLEVLFLDNEFYGLNRIMGEYSRMQGVFVWSIFQGTSFARLGRSFAITSHPRNWVLASQRSDWKEYWPKNSKFELKTVGEWLRTIASGTGPWVYSSGFQKLPKTKIFETLGIQLGGNVALALTSSPDEPVAAERVGLGIRDFATQANLKFSDQWTWLEYLIDQYRIRPNQVLVVRMHPRLLPNKRDGVESPFATQLRQLETNLPNNVKFNWPQDGISLWDLFTISDRVFNYTSTAGLEAILLGIPVVQYDSEILQSYPPSLNSNQLIGSEFGPNIVLSSAELWSKIVESYRWLMWRFNVFTLNPHSRIPDRRRLSLHRIMNWLVIRRAWGFLWTLLSITDALELKKQRRDRAFEDALEEVINTRVQGFEVKAREGFLEDPRFSYRVKAFHLKLLQRILGNSFEVVESRLG